MFSIKKIINIILLNFWEDEEYGNAKGTHSGQQKLTVVCAGDSHVWGQGAAG